MKYIIVMTVVVASFIFADNLVTNGDFEQELTTGWLEYSGGITDSITRATTYDPDPDYEAFVYRASEGGYSKLYQIIDIPSTDLDFSVNAKLYAYDNHTTAWTGASVMISYLNNSGFVLGTTRICARSTQCPWNNSSTMHIIAAVDSFWHNYSFNIETELANLSAVNPTDVRKIEIALFDSTYHC